MSCYFRVTFCALIFDNHTSMKKILLIVLAVLGTMAVKAETPNFSCVGFAAENGGTTGGLGGTAVTVTNLTQFKKYIGTATPYIIYVDGTLEGAGGGEMVEIGSNKTILGIGDKGKVLKVSFYCKNSKNLIIQNLLFSMSGSTLGSDADCITVATTGSDKCQNIWIDHCTFDNYIQPIANPSASQKDQYDGFCDIKKSSDYITISWCVFKNHYKCSLIGFTDTDTYDRKITYHHNAFINIGSRTPSYRGGTAHIYNNYWEGCYDATANKYFSTGVNTREGACLLVESNYFKDMGKTVYCAIEDVVTEGFATYRNNMFENAPAETANTCSSFTPPYTVNIDNTADVPNLVKTYAGVGILTPPSSIPDPEPDGGTGSIDAPYLNAAANINATGFDVSWNSVTGAESYTINASYETATGSGIVFKESFNNMKINDNLTSGTTDNPAASFALVSGGSLTSVKCEELGSVKLAGTRFCVVGLNLTGSLVLTVKAKALTSAGRFQIALDVAGTSGVSGLLNATCGTDVPNTEFKTFSIPITTGTASSYIQFRTESTATVYIDEITISNGNPTTVVNLTPVTTSGTSHSFAALTEGTEYKVWVTAKDGSGNSSASSNAIYVTPQSSTPTAVAPNEKSAITVVAANGKLKIKGASHSNVAVYSAMGQQVYQGMLLGDDELLPIVVGKGLYLVKTGQQTTKVLVK